MFRSFSVSAAVRFLAATGIILASTMAIAGPRPSYAEGNLTCNFGAEPEPNTSVTNPVFLSVAFSCFRNGTLVAAPPAKLFLDGEAIPFNRQEDFGTANLFTTVHLSHGAHTAKITVEGDGHFIWSFTVVPVLPNSGDADLAQFALMGLLGGAFILAFGLRMRMRGMVG